MTYAVTVSTKRTCSLVSSSPLPSGQRCDSGPAHNHVTSDSETTGVTVVSWTPASVSHSGVFYGLRLDGVVGVASTARTSVTLRDLVFDTTYTVTVEPHNSCGVAGTPLLGTIRVTVGE